MRTRSRFQWGGRVNEWVRDREAREAKERLHLDASLLDLDDVLEDIVAEVDWAWQA